MQQIQYITCKIQLNAVNTGKNYKTEANTGKNYKNAANTGNNYKSAANAYKHDIISLKQ